MPMAILRNKCGTSALALSLRKVQRMTLATLTRLHGYLLGTVCAKIKAKPYLFSKPHRAYVQAAFKITENWGGKRKPERRHWPVNTPHLEERNIAMLYPATTMLSFLRAPMPPKTHRADDAKIIYEDGTSWLEFQPQPYKFFLRNQHPPWSEEQRSIMVPPFHFHLNQTENFQIVSGTVHLYKNTLDNVWMTLTKDGQQTASVPPKVYHTLRNASTTEPMVIDVSFAPENEEGEERFFRNFFGYLDDCRKSGQKPSKWQLMVFLRDSDTPLGLEIRPAWLGLWASRIYLQACGLFGQWILGYQPTYKEYYRSKNSK